MQYLVKVGKEETRIYGLTSQAYFIKRSGKKVVTRWGAINVEHKHRIKLRWKWSRLQYKIHKFKTEAEAKEFKQNKINIFLARSFNIPTSDIKIYPRLNRR